ncbi:hypothetical protein RJ639_020361 [Escallonia herrerae]|uniref:DNA-directed RNA polymerases I, II, and III subunit RPABC3 n=1 Tax=Escallonia herrerae TaxID=1293975 RepID=A0AA89AGD7_9ASTE|nr:hypothetical protein RJ639_020361 [Escallonia herrerae]
MAELYFDDIINVGKVDADGKKFDKVSRIEAVSEEYEVHVVLDVNSDLYPIQVGQRFRMVLAQTLNLDGSAVTSYFPEGKQKSLADKFEYVMHGLLYKISEEKSASDFKVVVYISFGGLQLALKGDPSMLAKFKVDQRLFLLMRNVETLL